MVETLSAAEARRITLAAQGFTMRRPARVTARHVHTVMQHLGVLQIDSVNVFARSHYLPLFSRLGAYSPDLLDRTFLDTTEHYVEYLAHEAAFMPVTDWPLWEFRRERFRQRWHAGGESWGPASDSRTVQWIRDELRSRGPLRPAEIRGDAPRAGGGWWNWDAVKLTLETLWRTGEVAIAGRRGFERRYALAEHVVPAEVREPRVSDDDAATQLIERAARSYGVATASDLRDYYRLRSMPVVLMAIQRLVDSGILIPVTVRGWERGGKPVATWMHRDAAVPRRVSGAALLTPFDPVVWFRERALRAFDLDYRIEIYTPAAKRQYGYYSLPVLVGDRIVARVDLKADRAASTLLVQSAWWEPQAKESDAADVASELALAAAWQGLERISVSGWGTATDALRRAFHGHDVAAARHVHDREGVE